MKNRLPMWMPLAYSLSMLKKPLTIVETELFLKQSASVWTEDERAEFVDYIARNPDVGDIIPDTGGVRKVRWGRQGSGKRGGVRVIYFYLHANAPLYLLLIYAKAHQSNLTPEAVHVIQGLSERLKRAHRPRPDKKAK